MAYTPIDKGENFFNTVLYTGNGSTQSITGVGFQPDMIWQKERSNTSYHVLTDAVRGNTKQLFPNDTSGDATSSLYITSFDSDGFGQGQNDDTNQNSQTYASWNWKANGAGSSNTDGTINSTVSANTTSGFSIVKYTGTGSAGTVGHGLGSTPKMIIVKTISASGNYWTIYHQAMGNTNYIFFNNNGTTDTADTWNDTSPTSSVFHLGTDGDVNTNGATLIAYCFADVQGYSKFDSYTGNGSTDGNFIYLGFKASFFLVKRITDGTEPWIMFDNKRNTFNGVDKNLKANLQEVEATQNPPSMDFLSNGLKFRNTDGTFNNSGKEFIYMAFAENPFVSSTGVPVCAR